MEKYRLGFSIHINDTIVDFESPPLDRKQSYELLPGVSKLVGDKAIDHAVTVRKYTEVARSIAQHTPEL